MQPPTRKPIRILVLSVLLCALLVSGSAQDMATPRDMLSTYRRVTLGEQPYWQVDPFMDEAAEAFLIPEISQWYCYVFDAPLCFEAFAVTDLDKDGNPELLLKLSEDFGFELLRYFDGAVYGYPYVARAMEAITADGEIHLSGGANNFGWVTLAFNGMEEQRPALCWMSDEETDTVRYTIHGDLVAEDAFKAFSDALWAKDMLTWTTLTPDALDAALTGN